MLSLAGSPVALSGRPQVLHAHRSAQRASPHVMAARPHLRAAGPRALGREDAEGEAAKVVREFNEDTGVESAPKQQPKYLYADENPPPPRDTMSPEMKARLRKEYLSLGGAPDVAATNWALYIILGVSFLAVASWLTGAL